MQKTTLNRHKLFIAMSAATLSFMANGALAQDQEKKAAPVLPAIEAPALEEMLVQGRQQSGAQSVLQERMEDAFSADLMDSTQISRTGDSNVAIALTRVTGVTLNQGKYVYVRGLGERYSSVQLNGAQVPSPELSRNVLPLDIIPSSIVDTLKVQKSYSPDLPAAFGGGNVDIRTKSVPSEFVLELSVGTGTNTNNGSGDLSYAGGKSDSGLPSAIADALDTYQGKINVNGILNIIDTDGGSSTSEQRTQAAQINRNLMLSLNRDLEIKEKKSPIDSNFTAALGDSWDINDEWTIGGIVNASQKTEWRNKDQEKRSVISPDINYSKVKRTSEDTKTLLSAGVGVKFQDNHQVEASYLDIGNDSDEASITLAQNNNNTVADGKQKVTYKTRFQERELKVTQVLGKHSFDQLSDATFGNIDFDWFYSDSSVTTNVPGASTLVGDNAIDPATGEVISTSMSPNASNSFAFLKLQDDVRSYGWNFKLPISMESVEVEFTGGYSYNDKARSYYGHTVWINTGAGSYLQGTPGDVFTDANISNLNNAMELTMNQGFGTESYVAAEMNDSFYGMVDMNLNDIFRITAGVRHEDFRRALLTVDLLDYTGESIKQQIEALNDPNQTMAVRNDDWYPSLALTYMNDGFMGAETFQLRGSYSKTVVRPDLRELSDVVYIDPELEERVQGNPYLQDAIIDNFEIRGEWYYDNGNNLTASFFYKEISNPIEQKLSDGSDQDLLLGFYNAESGQIIGLEIEGLYNLDNGFFVSSNLTLSDSEIVSSKLQGFTNETRAMTGLAPYILNMQLGYDSDNGEHGATLAYNIAGKKFYFATLETSGLDDSFEKPFSSLDFTYSYYPTEQFTLKLKLRNLLDENREFVQAPIGGKEVSFLTQEIGTSMSMDISYKF